MQSTTFLIGANVDPFDKEICCTHTFGITQKQLLKKSFDQLIARTSVYNSVELAACYGLLGICDGASHPVR